MASPHLTRASAFPHCVATLGLRHSYAGHTGCVNSATFSEDGCHIVTTGDDTDVCVWSSITHRRLLKFASGHNDNVFDAKLLGGPLSETSSIVSAGRDGGVWRHVLRGGGGDPTSTRLYLHGGTVHKLALMPGSVNNEFFSAGEDGNVVHYDVRCAQPATPIIVGELLGLGEPLCSTTCAVSPSDPSKLLLGGGDTVLRVFDTRFVGAPCAAFCPGHLKPETYRHENVPGITGAAWSSERTGSRRIVASYGEESIYVFDLVTTEQYRTPELVRRAADGSITRLVPVRVTTVVPVPVSVQARTDIEDGFSIRWNREGGDAIHRSPIATAGSSGCSDSPLPSTSARPSFKRGRDFDDVDASSLAAQAFSLAAVPPAIAAAASTASVATTSISAAATSAEEGDAGLAAVSPSSPPMNFDSDGSSISCEPPTFVRQYEGHLNCECVTAGEADVRTVASRVFLPNMVPTRYSN